MKRIGMTAALAALLLTPLPAQAQGEKPAAAKAAAAQPSHKPAPDAPRQRSRANEDARSCLELATNPEIRKCAEQYR